MVIIQGCTNRTVLSIPPPTKKNTCALTRQGEIFRIQALDILSHLCKENIYHVVAFGLRNYNEDTMITSSLSLMEHH